MRWDRSVQIVKWCRHATLKPEGQAHAACTSSEISNEIAVRFQAKNASAKAARVQNDSRRHSLLACHGRQPVLIDDALWAAHRIHPGRTNLFVCAKAVGQIQLEAP